jgi:DNA (cytosine-5)-methyltransferase 1
MKLLDLYCGGGAAVGYHRAGFEDITGVDIVAQPRYPFRFIQSDSLQFLKEHGSEYDLSHASPPCQGYSQTRFITGDRQYPKHIEELRELLISSGKPYVIENVVGAPLINPVRLTGLMFGLKVYRARLFETNWFFLAPPEPANVKVYTNADKGHSSFENGATHICVAGNRFCKGDAAIAMDIDWPMSKREMAQAIPPAYTNCVGRQAIQVLGVVVQ